MKDKKSSFSAEVVAIMRIVESRRTEKERVLYDPYAEKIIRPGFHLLLKSRLITKIVCWYIEKKGPGFRGGIAARTCYIDDLLNRSLADGITQFVILGAGCDARAYRIDALKKIRVFEVEFPATLDYKISRIKKIFGAVPDHVTYVPVDFVTETSGECLLKNGYDPTQKTFFIWEGVTMYLTPGAVDETLTFISENSAPGSAVHFDYMRKAVLDGRCMLPESQQIRNSASFMGNGEERFTLGMEEDEVHRLLTEKGLTLVEDLKGDELEKKYSIIPNVHQLFGYVYAVVN